MKQTPQQATRARMDRATGVQCDHLRVLIKRTIRARSKAGTRTIGGECSNCGATVSRVQTAKELKTGERETWYK